MNQQRSRRFRTAQEAKEAHDKAVRRGEEIPDSPPFDSNCITPGTVFMRKLSRQLEYFIAKKVSEDANWRDVQVILSGHEACGEGEHKIMEFVRTLKAQPGYDPNTRHCLYGLDADLIMLGLLSHDPHFALLREEVTFGPRRGKKTGGLETQTFYLLHLSLLREYLEMEFDALKTKLSFPFDLERIIDDYILLHLFVGNDFLPHLPGLHINEGAIELLFRIYEKVLPQAGGYLNEQGILHPERLQLIINELFQLERDNFVRDHMPKQEAPSKTKAKGKGKGKKGQAMQMCMTPQQRDWVTKVHEVAVKFRADPGSAETSLAFPAKLPAADLTFLHGLADALQLEWLENEYDPVSDTTATTMSIPTSTLKAICRDDAYDMEFLEQSEAAVRQALQPYLDARVEVPGQANDEASEETSLPTEPPLQAEREREIDDKLVAWKSSYYQTKMGIKYGSDAVKDLVYNYIEGMQWVLHYYYEGNASWGWFYRYHYAPQVSDMRNISDFTFHFEKGTPFLPFEQLMGVLPPLSKQLIPPAFQDLMTDPSSSILDFYPTKYESDMNGKKNSWEAVVKIPFIEESRLLDVLHRRANGLTAEERERNTHGVPHQFVYDASYTRVMPSSLPGFLPDLPDNHTRISEYVLPSMEGKSFVKTLPEGVGLGLDAMPGFPSMKTLSFKPSLRKFGVNVHGTSSQGLSMILAIEPRGEKPSTEALAKTLIGTSTYIHWPYLFEGLVVGVSDSNECFRAVWKKNQVGIRHDVGGEASLAFRKQTSHITSRYANRYGVVLGAVDVLLHVRPLKGLILGYDGSIKKEYEPLPDAEVVSPWPLVIDKVKHEDTRFLEHPSMSVAEAFPDSTRVFFLGSPGFGCPGRVIGTAGDTVTIELAFIADLVQEHSIIRKLVQQRAQDSYFHAGQVANRLKISSLVLSKLTSSIFIMNHGQKSNIGLNLKFEARSRKVLGYTRRGHQGWEYSERAVLLVVEFMKAFPEIPRILARRLKDGEYYDVEEVFPTKTDERMTALRAWQKEHHLRDLEDVPLYVERLERPIIEVLESAVAIIAQRRAEGGAIKRQILRGLPREALLKPEHAKFRVPEQSFELGDRVINVLDFGFVPLAAKGTVVAIGTDSIDVVFDAPFLAGTTLGGICSQYRGATVGRAHVLNLSTPQIATKWGELSDLAAMQSTPLQRTLHAENLARPKVTVMGGPQSRSGGMKFFQPATLSGGLQHAKARSPASNKQVDAATSHLAALSLKKPAKPNAWNSPKPQGQMPTPTPAPALSHPPKPKQGKPKAKPHQKPSSNSKPKKNTATST